MSCSAIDDDCDDNNDNVAVKFGSEARAKLFALSPTCNFLNHGSFGTVPVCVRRYRHALERRIEANTDLFFRVESYPLWRDVLSSLADNYLHCSANDVTFVANATTGVQVMLDSCDLHARDVVLSPCSAYGAVQKIITDACERAHARYVQFPIQLPVSGDDDIVDALATALEQCAERGEKVRLVLFDHIVSTTAVVCPIQRMAELVKSRSPQTTVCVDGAHAVGQVPIDLKRLGSVVDYYTSNLHKWLYGCRSAAILYVHKRHQTAVRPPIVSHEHNNPVWDKRFFAQATRDLSPYLSAMASIKFCERVGGYAMIRSYIHELLDWAVDHLTHVWQLDDDGVDAPNSFCPPSMHGFMRVLRLPLAASSSPCDNVKRSQITAVHSEQAVALMTELLVQHATVTVVSLFNGHLYTRLSCNIYNTRDDFCRFGKLVNDLRRKIK